MFKFAIGYIITIHVLKIDYIRIHALSTPTFSYILESYIDGGIKLLKYIGSLVDKFLESEEDFWLFDYIVNVVCADEENRLNAYHTFKVMSLIEMIIVNPKNEGRTQDEVENKLSLIFTRQNRKSLTCAIFLVYEKIKKQNWSLRL